MIALWMLLIAIECYCVYIYYKKTEKIFNHLTLFSIGFFLYLILPNLFGEIGIYKGESFMHMFYIIYDAITLANKILSYLFIFVIYVSFSYGTIRKKRKEFLPENYKTVKKSTKKKIDLFKIVGIILILLVIAYIIYYKDAFFKGYQQNNYNKGAFAALVLVVFSYMLLYTGIKIKESNKILKSLLNPYVFVFLVISVLLLSLGTRMYFIANIFTILVLIEYRKKISIKKSIAFIFIVVLIVGIIGMTRSSYEFSISGMIINILIEFLYTGLSLIKFIEIGTFELIKFPKFLLSNLLNLIPTMVFPDKLKYVLNPSDYGYVIYNPQGALSIYIELMINFGFIGSIFVAFISGNALDKLRNKTKDNTLYLIMYSMISGFLIFSIFRDSLAGSLIKNILEFSIILPSVYYYIYRISNKEKDKPKKETTVVQINVSSGGSTGNIMRTIKKYAENEKINIISFYGRGREIEDANSYKISNNLEIFCNVFLQRFFAKGGAASFLKTKKLIWDLERINPDILHLHNIHGYYLNYKVLFNYIIKNKIKTIWTLHDCWAYTGHCAYYSSKKCDKWQNKCQDCANLKEYPRTLVDNSLIEYETKRTLFTNVNDLTLVTPSNWLKEEVKKSFLNKFDIKVINNGVDLSKFKFIDDEYIRKKYNLGSKKVILGVASVWDDRKGLKYFVKLSKLIKEDEIIFLVGLNNKQIQELPANIIGITKTENQEELAQIYSMSNVFFNPSKEETFSLVTVEAMACGVPCVIFNETAVPELINSNVGKVIEDYSIENIYRNIEEVIKTGKQKYFEACIDNSKKYDINNFKNYIELYKELVEEK